jgi:single-strand DNA-binding protein
MAVSLNRVLIAGNLTRDPQLKQAGSAQVCNFGIAINDRYKAADGTMKETTTFVEVEAWQRTAELCAQYLAKGRSVFVEGKLTQSTYEKDGVKVTKTRVRADSVQFLSAPQSRDERNTQLADTPATGRPPNVPAANAIADDEPPF